MLTDPSHSPRALGLAGGVCTLLGIGIARFAYTPLIPALVNAGWFSVHAANYLGAINLLGYLIGAATAHRLSVRLGVRRVLAIGLLITLASLYGCALDWGIFWYGFWRLACGISGAVLVVIGVPAALSRVSVGQRPGTGALVFSGIGFGIAASGTLVPWLAGLGISATWLALAFFASLLAAWAWFFVLGHLKPLAATAPEKSTAFRLPVASLVLVMAAYGLDAAGFVPHTLFWVDFIAHELGRGLSAGGRYWVIFGIGAACGPWVASALAKRLGFLWALAFALGVKTLAVALPLISVTPVALALSSFLVGLLIPAAVTLTSGALTTLAPPARQQQVWGWATLSFALMQAGTAYGMSSAYARLGSYLPLFAVAALALALACLAASCAALRATTPSR